MSLLVADVGGTKTALAIVEDGSGATMLLDERELPSQDYGSFEELVGEYLKNVARTRPTQACVGAAGPIVEQRVRLTNLEWEINSQSMKEIVGLRDVQLLNDVEATAYGTLILDSRQKRTLWPGEPVEHGTIAVFAPGTGLGKAFLIWDGRRYRAQPSEGGHAGFAPFSELSAELTAWLRRGQPHVSYEWVCSGRGIPRIYAFLREKGVAAESPRSRAAIVEAEDPTPEIVRAAFDAEAPCALCLRTMELFAAILGSAAGDMALEVLSTGGLFLAGGMPARVLPALVGSVFKDAFSAKGPMTDLAGRIPVHVVLEQKTALIGAAYVGLMREE